MGEIVEYETVAAAESVREQQAILHDLDVFELQTDNQQLRQAIEESDKAARDARNTAEQVQRNFEDWLQNRDEALAPLREKYASDD